MPMTARIAELLSQTSQCFKLELYQIKLFLNRKRKASSNIDEAFHFPYMPYLINRKSYSLN